MRALSASTLFLLAAASVTALAGNVHLFLALLFFALVGLLLLGIRARWRADRMRRRS